MLWQRQEIDGATVPFSAGEFLPLPASRSFVVCLQLSCAMMVAWLKTISCVSWCWVEFSSGRPVGHDGSNVLLQQWNNVCSSLLLYWAYTK